MASDSHPTGADGTPPLARSKAGGAERFRAEEARLAAAFTGAGVGMVLIDAACRISRANPRYLAITGRGEDEVVGGNCLLFTHPEDRDANAAAVEVVVGGERDALPYEKRYVLPDGGAVWVRITLTAMERGPDGRATTLLAVVEDVTERVRAEAGTREQGHLLGMIAAGRPLEECLAEVTAAIGRLLPGVRACVLVPDASGATFERTFAAEVPISFRGGIHGAAVGEFAIGTCGVAVWAGKPVSCPDISGEGPWAREWRDLCLAHGFRACHSEPVIGTDGRAVASLALYFGEARALTPTEREGAVFGARIAALALERDRATEALREAERRKTFLLALAEVLRDSTDAVDAQEAATALLGRHLGAAQAGFAEVEGDGEHIVVRHDWGDGSIPSVVGRWRMDDFGPAFIREMRGGRTVAIPDVTLDSRTNAPEVLRAYAGIRTRSVLDVPLIREGRQVALLFVHHPAPRAWTATEVALAEETVGRLWDAVERARAEAALRRSEHRLRRVNEDLEGRVAEEVAAREAAQAQLAHARRMEALGQLAGGIAHDINNVLQAVGGGAALIERRPGDPEAVRRLARMVAEAAERGSAVTRRLLAFSRRADLRAEAVEPVGLLTGMREILTHTLGTGIGVRVDAPPGLPPLLADKGQLETVLINLAANARDAMEGGGLITLAAATEVAGERRGRRGPASPKPGAYVRLSVTDTGIGMTPEVLARATEPFFTTKGTGKGTGLGLAMARGFAEQSGGALRVESAPGQGTTVSLLLPLAEAAAAPAVPTLDVPFSRTAEGERRRILLVDDDAAVREITAEGLEGCRRGCGGKEGWRSLWLVQRAMTGVGAPAETTPWARIAWRTRLPRGRCF